MERGDLYDSKHVKQLLFFFLLSVRKIIFVPSIYVKFDYGDHTMEHFIQHFIDLRAKKVQRNYLVLFSFPPAHFTGGKLEIQKAPSPKVYSEKC